MLKGQNISYSHKEFEILKAIDFSVAFGKLIVIVGPNGAGKSTLLSILSNELESTADILFKEKDLKKWKIDELSTHKAKFSQQYNTDIPLFVHDVVLMGRYPYFENKPSSTDLEAVEKAMHQTDVFHLKNRDYNTLSGGEKQRVHLARVLTQLKNDIQNKLIFLDEPLNNLDVLHQHRILETIKEFTAKGNTAIVVLHDLNLTAQFADKVFLMKNGKVKAYDVPEKVFTQKIVSEIYDFPCMICENPVYKKPMIVFGNARKHEAELV
ncbi:MAG: heme ABC transporter ATP-binding protein [Flavobacteriaceae bacterium]